MVTSSRIEPQEIRDRRVITENIKAGRGYSSAEHKPKAAASGGGQRSTSPYKLPKKAPKPQSRPDMSQTAGIDRGPSDPGEDRATRFRQDPWSASVGNTPNPYGGFPPDLAPSPNPFQAGSPVNPNTMPAGPNPFSPDLAPSPNPYAMNSPVNPHPLAMPANPGMAAAQALGAAFGKQPFTGPMPRHNALGGNPIFGDYPTNTLQQYSLPKLW